MTTKVAPEEISDGQALFRAKGWLAETSSNFREMLLDACDWSKVDRGFPLSRGDDTSGGIFGLAHGSIGIVPAVASPDAGLIHIDTAPFWYGLQPFVTGQGRQATIVARTLCIVVHVGKIELRKILNAEPTGWEAFMRQQLALTSMAIQSVSDLLIRSPERRCTAVLLRIAKRRDKGDNSSIVLCTQDELATMCNLSRQAVAPILNDLARRKLIALGYRQIEVLQPSRLRERVDNS